MRLLLLARERIGFNVLDFLFSEYPDDIAAVVAVREDEIHELARRRGVPAFVCGRGADPAAEMRKTGIEADLGAMVWWPYIIREPLLSFPARGFVNAHPALLPHCRGSMSNFWALTENAPYGVTIHKVDAKVDHGAVLAQTRIEVEWTDTDETLYHRALAELEKLFIEIYPRLRNGELKEMEQDFSAGSYHDLAETAAAARLVLDEPTTARKLLNLLRARSYAGADGCWFEENGERYEARVKISNAAAERNSVKERG